MGDWRRQQMAQRVRALEGRIERLATCRNVELAWSEWCELEEWWAHQPFNDEALRILVACRENIAWSRCQRHIARANELARRKKLKAARDAWRWAIELLETDWSTMYRREPCPTVEAPPWYIEDSS